MRLARAAICAATVIDEVVAGVPPRTERVGLGSPLCWFRAGLVLVQIAMGAMTRPGERAVANDLAFTGVGLGGRIVNGLRLDLTEALCFALFAVG